MPGDSPDGQCVSKLGRGGWEAFGGEGQCVSEYVWVSACCAEIGSRFFFYQKSQLASHRGYLQPFTENASRQEPNFAYSHALYHTTILQAALDRNFEQACI